MSGTAALTRSWPVGTFTCTLSMARPEPGQPLAAVIEWAPELPRSLSAKHLAEYRAGRNAALAALARELGGAVALVEL